MTDNDLLESLQRGDSDAFTHLVDQYQHKVTNICYRFLHNKEDAQDVTQEVFLAIYKSFGTFRQEAKLSTWIYRIAVTRSLNFLKKRKRKARFEQVRDMLTLKEEAGLESAPVTTPEKELEQQEQLRILQQALDALPKNQKTAFTLSQYDGVKYAEIASIMETTVSSVESLIFRARKNLQKKLSHYYGTQK
ncbi:MAG: sigma-70 family RNA polymerase sigma factor [Desulfuromusa sp.]|nr:sigma-70 family RNA polymerase sigma factor [Desulfuromusa sp.]